MTNLLDIEECGTVNQLEPIKQMFFDMVSSSDVLDALNRMRAGFGEEA